MKKIINNPEYIVRDMIDGMVAAFPNKLRKIEGTTVLVRKNAPVEGKVGLISGGGSGHEPAHGGYIGRGMLDAAVAGEVFTSPSPDQIFQAIKAVDSGKGVFMIIKNYTGDVINFEMASEMAEAEGISVRKVIVNDDVAVEDNTDTTGRRGVAGTVFVHKLVGATAEKGCSLDEVKRIAELAVKNVRSMGIALTPCIMPVSGEPGFEIDENEMGVGIGIHGEPGIEHRKMVQADKIAEILVDKVLDEKIFTDDVAVMVNGMGATPEMELFILNNRVQELLLEKGLNVYRTFVGDYMTSMEMAGCSLTLLKLDEELKELLDYVSEAPAFKV